MNNKKWTKKYLLVIWVVTLIIVVGAVFSHALNFGFAFLGAGWGNGKTVTESYDFTNESIDKISIDMSAADVNIKYGNEFAVEAKFPEKLMPNVEVANGTLTVVQKNSNKFMTGINDYKLDITIPDDSEINVIDIEINAGDLDISDIKINSIDIDANAGDIDINDIKAAEIVIDADAGDINVMDATAKAIQVNLSAGDVDISGTYDTIDCECSAGDIDINAPDTALENIDVDCAFGSTNVNGKSRK